jgi:hypothetical protein
VPDGVRYFGFRPLHNYISRDSPGERKWDFVPFFRRTNFNIYVLKYPALWNTVQRFLVDTCFGRVPDNVR